MSSFAKRTVLSALMIAASWVLFTLQAHAARRSARSPDQAAEELEKVLAAEPVNGSLDRRGELAPVLSDFPGHEQIRWQSGFVTDGEQWRHFEQVATESLSNADLNEYRTFRKQTEATPEGHLLLANSCKKHNLLDEERAHLTAILDAEPDNATIRARMGYQLVQRQWMTQQELQEAERSARQAARDLAVWQPKLEKLRDRLTSDIAKRREAAVKDLQEIQAPEAVPAIELVLATHDEACAVVAVEQLSQMSHKEATVGLARQAVFSPWPAVRNQAAQALRSRNLRHFVPPLLSLLFTPIQSKVEIYTGPTNTFFYRHTFLREGADQIHKRTFATTNFATDWSISHRRLKNVKRDNSPDQLSLLANSIRQFDESLRSSLALSDAERTARDDAKVRNDLVEQQNSVLRELNRRVKHALASATEMRIPEEPESMWQWWNDYNGVVYESPKPEYEVSYNSYVLAPPILIQQAFRTPGSCLAAGSPVWTSRGEVPIEQIEIGDRVLAKNIETGELAYKPVLKTTIRPKVPIVETVFEDGTAVKSTTAHPFWVSGLGWTRARDFQHGHCLHGATGTASVVMVEEAGRAPVYNLIVADFHTYFVGSNKVLSHDVTIAEPTDRKVPGLVQ